jgi:hypothetical protein
MMGGRFAWAFLLVCCTSAAGAAHPPRTYAHAPTHSQRSFHEKSRVVYRANGRPMPRTMYRGYYQNLPAPAYLYYGYPGSGHSYGVGF